jgi:hypothetical protein
MKANILKLLLQSHTDSDETSQGSAAESNAGYVACTFRQCVAADPELGDGTRSRALLARAKKN